MSFFYVDSFVYLGFLSVNCTSEVYSRYKLQTVTGVHYVEKCKQHFYC